MSVLSPVDLENKNIGERNAFLDEVTGGEPVVQTQEQQEPPPAEVVKTEEVKPVAKEEPEIVAPDKKDEATNALDRLASKKKPDAAKVETGKKTESESSAQDAEAKKAAEEKKAYKWGELKKAAEEDLPKAIADRDAALAERDKLNQEMADLRAAASERDNLKAQTAELQSKLYVHDVRELPQYRENREVMDSNEATLKKASDIHRFNFGELRDAMLIEDPTERSSRVDEILDSAGNPIGLTSRARLAAIFDNSVDRKGFEKVLETNQKAALEAYKTREMQQTQAQKAKGEELYGIAAKNAFEKMKAGIPALSDAALAKRVQGVPRISEQSPAMQAAAGFALELLPDLLEKHEEEIAGHKATIEEKDEEIKKRDAIIAKYSGAGASVKTTGEVKTKAVPVDFMDEIEQAVRSGAPIS